MLLKLTAGYISSARLLYKAGNTLLALFIYDLLQSAVYIPLLEEKAGFWLEHSLNAMESILPCVFNIFP